MKNVKWKVQQIIPAAPHSYAISESADDGFLSSGLIAAWGICDPVESYVDPISGKPVTREILPLVQEMGGLIPYTYDNRSLVGTVVAGFWSIYDEEGYDARLLDPARHTEALEERRMKSKMEE